MVAIMGTTNIIKKGKNIIIGIIIIVLVVGIVSVYFYSFNNRVGNVNNEETKDYHTITYNNKTYEYNSSVVSILFMGIDTTNPDENQGQADVMELLLLDRSKKTIHLISIPRDTMTDIRMFDVEGNDLGWQRQHLNLAYAYGNSKETGCMYTLQAVSRLFNDVPIVRYASMNLNELEDIHSLVGELRVRIPNNSLQYENPNWIQGNFATLTKKNVEQFLRTRDVEKDFSNEERMERQEAYLKAYYNKLKEKLNDSFEKTITEFYEVCKGMTTNITYDDMETFGKMVLDYEFDDNNYIILGGENVSGDYHDEFEVDKKKLESTIVKLFYKEEESK